MHETVTIEDLPFKKKKKKINVHTRESNAKLDIYPIRYITQFFFFIVYEQCIGESRLHHEAAS